MPIITTIAAVTSLAASAFGAGKSFSNAAKQNKLQKQAESDAAKAMAEARKKLEVNYYDKLSLIKEPFEREREAMIAAGAAGIAAGQEADPRGSAATAGRIQLGVQQGQREIAGAMGEQLQTLEKLSAAEDSRLRDIGTELDLAEVEGAQLKARDAQQAAAAFQQQGMEGITDFAEKAYKMAPAFERDFSSSQSEIGQMSFNPSEFQKFGNVPAAGGLGAPLTDGFTNLDFESVGKMSPDQFDQFIKTLNRNQKNMLRSKLLQSINPYNVY